MEAAGCHFRSSDFTSKYFNHALVQRILPGYNGPGRDRWYEFSVDESEGDAAWRDVKSDLAAHKVPGNRFFETEHGHFRTLSPRLRRLEISSGRSTAARGLFY
jgi:hypothetical protein